MPDGVAISAAPPHSAVRAFLALVSLTLRRHWRVRSLGWVTLGLLGLMTTIVAVITHGPVGWRLERQQRTIADLKDPNNGVRMTYKQYGEERLTFYQMLPGSGDAFAIRSLVFAPFRAIMQDQEFLDDWAFVTFSRWVIFAVFLGFLMPLFTLAFASGAMGTEREDRTLIWLLTRPIPRGAVYLAKFAGVLPWCLVVSFAGFAALCLAGGDLGRRAFATYWPAVFAGTVGFAALFHLIGAVFRRPAVLGLVYIFFFEVLVANLPGSLKRLSLNYYCRSLLYNEAAAAAPAVTPEAVDVYAPVSPETAWAVLLTAAVALTLAGMWLFTRHEPKDDV
jgi:ABC-type transport system involved in multi-copper enzyme maturation permease subunit